VITSHNSEATFHFVLKTLRWSTRCLSTVDHDPLSSPSNRWGHWNLFCPSTGAHTFTDRPWWCSGAEIDTSDSVAGIQGRTIKRDICKLHDRYDGHVLLDQMCRFDPQICNCCKGAVRVDHGLRFCPEVCVRLRLRSALDTAHYYTVLEGSTVQRQCLILSSFPTNMRAKLIVLLQRQMMHRGRSHVTH